MIRERGSMRGVGTRARGASNLGTRDGSRNVNDKCFDFCFQCNLVFLEAGVSKLSDFALLFDLPLFHGFEDGGLITAK
jgi:hypothetical protein